VTIVTGLVVYIILWWLVLFMVLPWGIRTPEESAAGHVASAPAAPRLWLKFGVTTGVATVLWTITYVVIEAGLISLRDL
jgi:predicted secreted protein